LIPYRTPQAESVSVSASVLAAVAVHRESVRSDRLALAFATRREWLLLLLRVWAESLSRVAAVGAPKFVCCAASIPECGLIRTLCPAMSPSAPQSNLQGGAVDSGF